MTKQAEVAGAYLRRVVAEADLLAERLGDRRRVVQYHWGRGTPNFYPPDALVELHENLLGHFELAPTP